MNARYVQRGDSVDYTPTADVSAGDIINHGKMVGIAKLDIKAGELGALALTGVYEVVKGDAAFNPGDEVGWDIANAKAVVATTAGCAKIGFCIAAAASGDGFVNVRLEQGL